MPRGVVSAKAIEPSYLSIRQVRGAVAMSLRQAGLQAKKLYELTWMNWENEKPTVQKPMVRYRGGNAFVAVTLGGSEKGVQKFVWLDEGTHVRHAKLSDPWSSKTKVRSFHTTRGVGDVVWVSKKFRAKGIKARDWSLMIEDAMQDYLSYAISNSIEKAMDRLVRSIEE